MCLVDKRVVGPVRKCARLLLGETLGHLMTDLLANPTQHFIIYNLSMSKRPFSELSQSINEPPPQPTLYTCL